MTDRTITAVTGPADYAEALRAERRQGWQDAIDTMRDIATRTGSPAAGWAADYLTADPDLRGPIRRTDATPAPQCTPQDAQTPPGVGQDTPDTQRAAEGDVRHAQARAAGPMRLAFAALTLADRTCPYHGTDFDRTGMRQGLPNCDSCKQPYRVSKAHAAVSAWMDRITTEREIRIEQRHAVAAVREAESTWTGHVERQPIPAAPNGCDDCSVEPGERHLAECPLLPALTQQGDAEAAWQPAKPGDTPGALTPGEDDQPQPIDAGAYHIGRAWSGTEIENTCPCPKAPCGLVIQGQADPDCTQHPIARAKTIRQSHRAEDCPGPRTFFETIGEVFESITSIANVDTSPSETVAQQQIDQGSTPSHAPSPRPAPIGSTPRAGEPGVFLNWVLSAELRRLEAEVERLRAQLSAYRDLDTTARAYVHADRTAGGLARAEASIPFFAAVDALPTEPSNDRQVPWSAETPRTGGDAGQSSNEPAAALPTQEAQP